MFKEIESVAFECEYLFSKVRRLALSAGIEPTPRWFKSKIGVTEIAVRREVKHGCRCIPDTYRFLCSVRKRLVALERELRHEGCDSDGGSPEMQLSPRRRGARRGRDLLD